MILKYRISLPKLAWQNECTDKTFYRLSLPFLIPPFLLLSPSKSKEYLTSLLSLLLIFSLLFFQDLSFSSDQSALLVVLMLIRGNFPCESLFHPSPFCLPKGFLYDCRVPTSKCSLADVLLLEYIIFAFIHDNLLILIANIYRLLILYQVWYYLIYMHELFSSLREIFEADTISISILLMRKHIQGLHRVTITIKSSISTSSHFPASFSSL